MDSQPQPQLESPPPSSSPPPRSEEFIRVKRSYLYAALLPLTFIVGLASGFLIWGRSVESEISSNPSNPALSPPVTGVQEPNRFEVSPDDDPALGPDDAQVVIIEFSDFSCPFCQRFHQETFTDLMETYGDKIHFVYRDFPIVGGGQTGFIAAQAANCAAEQGDYWAIHDALFSGRYTLDRTGFGQYASELGLDIAELDECLDSERYAEEVQGDFRAGVDLGVTGTPTFFINGVPLVGAQPLSSFTSVIDSELAR